MGCFSGGCQRWIALSAASGFFRSTFHGGRLIPTSARTSSDTSPTLRPRETSQHYYARYWQFEPLSVLLSQPNIPEFRLPAAMRTLLRVTFTYGCRISEILQLTVADILPGDLLFVNCLKGGSNYVIRLPGVAEDVNAQPKAQSQHAIFNYGYARCYLCCCSLGIGHLYEGRKNHSRLHLARHRLAASVISYKSKVAAGDVLHHRSRRSINHYTH